MSTTDHNLETTGEMHSSIAERNDTKVDLVVSHEVPKRSSTGLIKAKLDLLAHAASDGKVKQAPASLVPLRSVIPQKSTIPPKSAITPRSIIPPRFILPPCTLLPPSSPLNKRGFPTMASSVTTFPISAEQEVAQVLPQELAISDSCEAVEAPAIAQNAQISSETRTEENGSSAYNSLDADANQTELTVTTSPETEGWTAEAFEPEQHSGAHPDETAMLDSYTDESMLAAVAPPLVIELPPPIPKLLSQDAFLEEQFAREDTAALQEPATPPTELLAENVETEDTLSETSLLDSVGADESYVANRIAQAVSANEQPRAGDDALPEPHELCSAASRVEELASTEVDFNAAKSDIDAESPEAELNEVIQSLEEKLETLVEAPSTQTTQISPAEPDENFALARASEGTTSRAEQTERNYAALAQEVTSPVILPEEPGEAEPAAAATEPVLSSPAAETANELPSVPEEEPDVPIPLADHADESDIYIPADLPAVLIEDDTGLEETAIREVAAPATAESTRLIDLENIMPAMRAYETEDVTANIDSKTEVEASAHEGNSPDEITSNTQPSVPAIDDRMTDGQERTADTTPSTVADIALTAMALAAGTISKDAEPPETSIPQKTETDASADITNSTTEPDASTVESNTSPSLTPATTIVEGAPCSQLPPFSRLPLPSDLPIMRRPVDDHELINIISGTRLKAVPEPPPQTVAAALTVDKRERENGGWPWGWIFLTALLLGGGYFGYKEFEKSQAHLKVSAESYYESAVKYEQDGKLNDARKYYDYAARQNHIPAQFAYAKMSEEGLGGLPNISEARKYYLETVKARDPQYLNLVKNAYYRLGRMDYESFARDGKVEDRKRAIEHLEKAHKAYSGDETGHADAEYLLWLAYRQINPKEANAYLRKARRSGSTLAMLEFSKMRLTGEIGKSAEDVQKGIEEIKELAKTLREAGYELGQLLISGSHAEHLPQNIPEGLKLIEQAAQDGYSTALVALGRIYLEGVLARKDPEKAEQYLKEAIEKYGDPEACYLLGKYKSDLGEDAQAFFPLKKGADRNHPGCLYYLGKIVWAGKNLARDTQKAVSYFRRAAELGVVEAQYTLGRILLSGSENIGVDLLEARKLLTQAAEAGLPEAQLALGRLLLENERDFVNARSWLENAEAQGLPESKVYLGRLYENGWGVEANPKKAKELYEEAAIRGIVAGGYYFGRIIYLGKKSDDATKEVTVDRATGWEHINKAANDNDPEALFFIASQYKLANERANALTFFERAHKAGHPSAASELAEIAYELGSAEYKLQKYENAMKYFEIACKLQHSKALFFAGYMHYEGLGTQKNREKAIACFEVSARLGYDRAQFNLASLYHNAENPKDADLRKAVYYYEQAAAQGVDRARFQLGMLYYLGSPELPQDWNKAEQYLLAAAQSDEQSRGDALYTLGMISMNGPIPDRERAIRFFEDAVKTGQPKAVENATEQLKILKK